MSLRDLIPFKTHGSRGNVQARGSRESNPFVRLHDEMDRLFEDFVPDFFDTGLSRSRAMSDWSFSPDVNVTEKRTEVVVKAELPGIDADGLDVRLENNVLTIRGEKREEHEQEEGNCQIHECRYGSFHRSIPMPTDVNADKVEADFREGILTVHLAKQEESEPGGRKIPVSLN